MIADPVIANDGNGRDADASDPGDWVTAAEAATVGGPFEDCEEASSSWHGTMVSGLIAAATDNLNGMASVGWNVRVLPVRVLGKCFGWDSDIVAGMRWAAGLAVPGLPANPNPARVLNLSLGGEGPCDGPYPGVLDELAAAGVTVVASAGNSAGHAVSVPANCPGVIGVAGLRHIGTKVGFSDLGPEIAIAAPAGNCVNTSGACLYPILTTTNAGTMGPIALNEGYTSGTQPSVGTSFSAPLVAGTAALMLSARPSLTPAEVKAALQSTARPFPQSGAPNDPSGAPVLACTAPSAAEQLECYCNTGVCGSGMLDAAAAVAAVSAPEARITVSPTAPVAGSVLTLSAATSVVAGGHAIQSWQWTLVDGGGIVTAFTGATNTATAAVQPIAGGSFTVRLTVIDDLGETSSAERSVTVQAPAPAPVEPVAGNGGGGGGGGAMTAGWLLALAAAAALLRRTQP
jgi:serine protease